MSIADIVRFACQAASGARLRTLLLIFAMSIGVSSVVILTALGDGARRYVVREFSAFGSNLVIILPGRSETRGFNPANAVTSTPRDLSVEDARFLLRAPAVRRLSPLAVGTSEISSPSKLRPVVVAGVTAEYGDIRNFKLGEGQFLPQDDWGRGGAVVVLGSQVRNDLFPGQSAVGQKVRLGDRRFRVIGVLAQTGQALGMNTDEIVLIPVSQAQAMFNSSTLFRVLVEARSREAIPAAKAQVSELLKQRHDGEEDFTVVTQDAVLSTFDRLLRALTFGVAGIAAISLAVAGILVMNVMLVSVTQRTAEIGLLKALGAARHTILRLFLVEAALLSLTGAVLGYGLGQLGAWILRLLYPNFPAYAPDWAVMAALGVALGTGLLFGWLPARRAADLDPVLALARH